MNNLYIHTKKILFLMFFCFVTLYAFGQQAIVEGTVISQTGDPLKNIKITVREAPAVKVYTDEAGNFSVLAETGNHLVVEEEYISRKIVKIEATGEEKTIVLDRASELINVGFNTTLRREEVASSVGLVRGDELDETVQVAGNALFGKIPGLRVYQNDGFNPHSRSPSMDIRGESTFNDNSILILIDGVERPITSVLAEDIESLTVLRDAASKARYGQYGANGVLLINTKRGSRGDPQYNVSFEQGMSQPDRVPQFLNAPAYARAVNEARENDGLTPVYSQTDIQRFESGEYPTFWPNVDWMDQTLNDMGQFSRINLNTSGGADAASYFVSLNYQTDRGHYNHTDRYDDFSTQLRSDKLNFRSNLDLELTQTTDLEFNMGGYIMYNQHPQNLNIVRYAWETPSLAFPIRNYDGTWGGTDHFGNNPVAELSNTGYNLTHERDVFVDIALVQDLTNIAEGLSTEVFIGYDNRANFWENSNQTYAYKQVIPVVDAGGAIVDTTEFNFGNLTPLQPNRSPGNLQTTHYDLRAKLNYTRSFGDHTIDSWVLVQQDQVSHRGVNNLYRHRNFVGNIHYGLAGKYFLDATVSYSGTNRIQKSEDRYGLFPAIAGAWIISREPFMEDVNFVNTLRLRASYGKTGNGRIPIGNLTSFMYGSGPGPRFGHGHAGQSSFTERQYPIESKLFESSLESNVGVEAQLFNNLHLSGDLFYINRKDIFAPTFGIYSAVMGTLPDQIPTGEVENKGYELEMTWSNQNGDFTYFVSGMFTHYQNKIISINEQYRPYDYMRREGASIGQFFGLETAGFFSSESDIHDSPFQSFGEYRPGDIKYVDQNGDGVIDQFDEKAIGNPSTPEIYYSASLGIGYKGLHLSALLQGTGRSSVFLNHRHLFWPLRDNDNMSTWYVNYWSEDNNSGSELPRLTRSSNENNFRANDIWIRDNSFLKVRYVTLSYLLPGNILPNYLQRAKIYLRGRNLFTSDNINYVDPENPGSHYPSLRMFNAGIQVTF